MSDSENFELLPMPVGVALIDLEVLLDAVIARLRACVAPQPLLADEPLSPLSERIRSEVLECATALDQLQITVIRALRC